MATTDTSPISLSGPTLTSSTGSATGTTGATGATGPSFMTLNYITNKIVRTQTKPNFGDPNTAVQTSVLDSFHGISSGGTSIASVSDVATPAAAAMSYVQSAVSSGVLSPSEAAQITAAMGPWPAIGGVPSMISDMQSHANNVMVRNPTQVMDAINTTYKPDQANAPGRCQDVGTNFIGSIQGAFNKTLTAISAGMAALTGALNSLANGVLTAVTGTIGVLVKAISSGVSAAITLAIGAVSKAFGALTSGLGGHATTAVGVGVGTTSVANGINNEMSNVQTAINSMNSNPFTLKVPNVNPCLKTISTNANALKSFV
jgi:hypothetical protein